MGRGQVEARVRDDLPSRAAIHGPWEAPAEPSPGVAAPRSLHARAGRRLLLWLIAAVALVVGSYRRTSAGMPAWAVVLIELPPVAVATWRTRGA